MRIFWMFAIPTMAAAIAGCGGAATSSDDGAARAATAFLAELRSGKVEPAWNAASTEFKSLMGLNALRDLVTKNPALRGEVEFAEARPTGVGLTECVFRGSNAKPRGKGKGKSTPVSIRVALSPAAEGWTVERVTVE